MKTDSKRRILDLAQRPQGASPHEIIQTLQISAVAVHKHLRDLTANGLLQRRGSPPRVIYQSAPAATPESAILFPAEAQKTLASHFTYFTPTGHRIDGVEGFLSFLKNTQQDKAPLERAIEYQRIVQEADKFRASTGLIDSTAKIKGTFEECFLERLYYSDFYSLSKYGKTRLGQYLLHGKSGQNKRLIRSIAEMTKSHVETIITEHRIEAVAFAPHSIPRTLQFLKEYRRLLAVRLPDIPLLKIFSGEVPIAQKSLSKLSERIENARQTIYIKDLNFPYQRILIIDDALGSGATMNEIARKLHHPDRVVIGYAVVGSYKEFEVIREI